MKKKEAKKINMKQVLLKERKAPIFIKVFLTVFLISYLVFNTLFLVGLFSMSKFHTNRYMELSKRISEFQLENLDNELIKQERVNVNEKNNNDFLNFFPLKKGNYWIYNGEVKWTKDNSSEVIEKEINWKIDVIDEKEIASPPKRLRDNDLIKNPIKAFLVNGYFSDLLEYNPNLKKSYKTIIIDDYSKYYLINGREFFDQINQKGNEVFSEISESELILDLPLNDNKKFNCQESSFDSSKESNKYCYYVASKRGADLMIYKERLVKYPMEYEIIYETLPDREKINYISGVGISKYVYYHKGTVLEIDLNLVDYKLKN